MNIQDKRKSFIEYQRQFYNENDMYDLISQSDQMKAINEGKYDTYMEDNFEVKFIKK